MGDRAGDMGGEKDHHATENGWFSLGDAGV